MMKKILTFLLFFIFLKSYAQGFKFDYDTPIKDISGKLIPLQEFDRLMDTGKWTMQVALKDNYEFSHIQLITKTEGYKSFESSLINKPKRLSNRKAPNFEAIDLTGHKYSSKELKGKIIFLHFILPNYKYGTDKIQQINNSYKKFKSNPNVFFLLVSNGSKKELEIFKQKNNIQYPISYNALKDFELYQDIRFPKYILINQKGEFEFVTSSKLSSEKEFNNQILRLLKKRNQ